MTLSDMQKDIRRLQYYCSMKGNIPEADYYRFCDFMEQIKVQIDSLSWSSIITDRQWYFLYLNMKGLFEKIEQDNELL